MAKRVIYAPLVISAMPWSERTAVTAYAMTVEWNTATAIAVNVSAKKMLSANNVIAVHPIITASAPAMDAGHATATWPRKAASATEKQDNASVCQVLPDADATSAFRDIGITDQMDVHVRLFFNYFIFLLDHFYKYYE